MAERNMPAVPRILSLVFLTTLSTAVAVPLVNAAESLEPMGKCDAVRRSISPRRISDPDEAMCSAVSQSNWNFAQCGVFSKDFAEQCPLALPEHALRDPVTRYTVNGSRYATCAVVSSSPMLLGTGCGAEVDAHEFVLRINAPAVDERFHADVGSRTSGMLLNTLLTLGVGSSPSWTTVNDPSTPNDVRPIKLSGVDVLSVSNWTAVANLSLDRVRDTHNMKSVSAVGQDFLQGVNRWWKRVVVNSGEGKAPETKGLYGVILALSLCDQVDTYGFVDQAPTMPYHYWLNTTHLSSQSSNSKVLVDVQRPQSDEAVAVPKDSKVPKDPTTHNIALDHAVINALARASVVCPLAIDYDPWGCALEDAGWKGECCHAHGGSALDDELAKISGDLMLKKKSVKQCSEGELW